MSGSARVTDDMIWTKLATFPTPVRQRIVRNVLWMLIVTSRGVRVEATLLQGMEDLKARCGGQPVSRAA